MTGMADITLTSIDTITCLDKQDQTLLFILDELQDANLSQEQETADITGKQGRLLNTLKRNKSVTVSGTNGLVSAGLLEQQTGANFATNTTVEIEYYDEFVVNDDAGALHFAPKNGVVMGIYEKDTSNGTLSTKYVQSTEAGTGKFIYNSTGNAISFYAGDIEDGTTVVAIYMREVTGSVLRNTSDTYSKKCEMFLDCTGEDKCANEYYVQIHVFTADFNGNFSFDIGGDQTVHEFEANALAGSCGAAGAFFDWTVVGYTELNTAS